jgi:DNA-binding transcriptional LysR family regulator
MDKMSGLDWSLVQTFLAVAESGSFSAAARRLGTTQPTVGRHVQTLEDVLGVALFRRQARGMMLTDAGNGLLDHARAMKQAAEAMRLSAAGGSSALSGSVRITASVFVSHYILPPILAEMREVLPEISIELVASDRAENLLFREADIAVRMFRPEQLDMVALHVGDVDLGLFGSRNYIQRRGRPRTLRDVLAHDVVGYDRNEEIMRGFRDAGFPVEREFFTTRCDNQAVYWELVRAGCGLGFGQVRSAETAPEVESIKLDIELPSLGVWLTAHETIRRTPRVDAVWKLLAGRLADACDRPARGLVAGAA